jgi:hypothetical protein
MDKRLGMFLIDSEKVTEPAPFVQHTSVQWPASRQWNVHLAGFLHRLSQLRNNTAVCVKSISDPRLNMQRVLLPFGGGVGCH